MSLRTFSQFFYGQNVDENNYSLDFGEGGPELMASMTIGDYTLSTILSEVKTIMDAAGALTYTVIVSRETRLVTISATGNFELKVSSGSRAGVSIFATLGFTGADRTGASSYTGDTPCGSVYLPQFILQDHIATDSYRNFIDPSVNISSSGEVEVVRFGIQKFLQCNIKYATSMPHPALGPITNNPTGYEDLLDFMNYITEKNKIEYMADVSDPNTYEVLLLESTDFEKDGTGYKLKEQYGDGLPFHFETGTLKFRKVS